MPIVETWNTLLRAIQWSSGAVGVFLNLILITLILFRSPNDLGAYKYLMIYISSFELTYSIFYSIIEPHVFSHGPAFIIYRYCQGSYFGRETGFYMIVLYCGSFGLSIALFGMHFIYRYGAADQEFRNSYIKGWKLSILFLIPVAYGVWASSTVHYLFAPSAESDSFLRTPVLTELDTRIENISYSFIRFYAPDTSNQLRPVWQSFVGMSCMWFMMFSSLFCVILFGIKCYRKISRRLKSSNMSSHYARHIQKQLLQALVVQTLIPVILMYIPVSLFFFPMINVEIGRVSSFVTTALAICPAVNPLPTMFIVESYRKTVLCGCWTRERTAVEGAEHLDN